LAEDESELEQLKSGPVLLHNPCHFHRSKTKGIALTFGAWETTPFNPERFAQNNSENDTVVHVTPPRTVPHNPFYAARVAPMFILGQTERL
jgi:hypothetical protein